VDWAKICAVVVPCHNESAAVGSLVKEIRHILPNVIVVDDGSSDGTADIAAQAGAQVLRNPGRRGKGTALKLGLEQARTMAFSWAILMDGDGQHSAQDIPAFLARAEADSSALIIGNRMHNHASMPWHRKLANRLSSWLLSRLAGRDLPDSQCGFRMVKLPVWSGMQMSATGFEIESEMLLAFIAAGYPVEFIPIRTIYGAEHSKFHPLKDTWHWIKWWSHMSRIRKQ
jgi:glycosyltransferase involved in cell wall biosynthesis